MKITTSFNFNIKPNKSKKSSSFSANQQMPMSPSIRVVTVNRLYDPAGNNPDRKIVRTAYQKIVYVFNYIKSSF